jgi:hypothetical protein
LPIRFRGVIDEQARKPLADQHAARIVKVSRKTITV